MASPAPAPDPAPARGLPCGATRCSAPFTAAQGGSRGAADLDAAAVRTWCSLALEALGRAREEIDAINVYPVADGDTGTNLYLTVESAAQAVEAVFAAHETERRRPRPADVGAGDGPRRASAPGATPGRSWRSCCAAWRSGLHGAGGRHLAAAPCARAAGLALRGGRASRRGHDPHRGARRRRTRRTGSPDDPRCARGVRRGPRAALDATPGQLEVLRPRGGRGRGRTRAAGGAAGRSLEAVHGGGSGRARCRHACTPAGRCRPRGGTAPSRRRTDGPGVRGDLPPGGRRRGRRPAADPAGRARVTPWSSSAATGCGTSTSTSTTRAPRSRRGSRPGGRTGSGSPTSATRAAGAGAAATQVQRARRRGRLPGEGLARPVRRGGRDDRARAPGEPPASGELVDGDPRGPTPARWSCCRTTRSCGTPPRRPPNRPAPRAYGSPLIPTRAAVQGIAALAVHEPDRRFDEDVVAMTSAAGATRYAELAVAERQSWTTAGVCQAGDILGLIDGDVAVIGADLPGTAARRSWTGCWRRAASWSRWSWARTCRTATWPTRLERARPRGPPGGGHGRLPGRPGGVPAAHRRGVGGTGPARPTRRCRCPARGTGVTSG